MAINLNFLGTGGIIEGDLGAANVNVNLDSVLEFDGVNDKITVSDHSSLDIVGDITLSAWVKITMGESDFKTIISKAPSLNNTQSPWQLRIDDSDKVEFVTGDGSSSVRVSSTNAIKEGWNHIAVTVDENGASSVVKYFINGVLDRTVSSGWTDYSGYTNNDDLLIGVLGTGYFHDGYLADVRIYNAVVSDADVAILASRINGDPSLTTAGTTNLQGWWKLNNNSVTDSSPNSNDGTASGPTQVYDQFSVDVYDNSTTTDGTFTVTQGKVEGLALTSLDFDGTDDRIALGTGLTIFDGATEGTVSAWIRRDAAGNVDTIISHFDSSDSNRQFNFLVDSSNKAKFSVQNEKNNFNSDHDAVGATDIDTNEWYHLVGTFSTTNGQKVYVNGVHDGTATTTIEDALDTVTTDAHIGVLEQGGSLSGHADGEIRDVKLFDYELSAEQISSLYSGTYPQTPNHHYKLDEGSGTAVEDHGTATDVDGTITGATYSNGTLDLDGALTIAANGTLSAPRGNLENKEVFENSGTYIHNNGTFIANAGGNRTYFASGSAGVTFYNFNHSVSADLTFRKACTFENLLTSTSASAIVIFGGTDAALTFTFGTTTSAGAITMTTPDAEEKGVKFSGNTTNAVTMAGASSLYPVAVTGKQWHFDNGGSGSKVKLANIDYDPDITTGGAGVTITLTGDCEFDAVTVSNGDTFDLNGQRIELSGTLNIDGTFDADGLIVSSGAIDEDGGFANAASCDMILTGATSHDFRGATHRNIMINTGTGTSYNNATKDMGTTPFTIASGTFEPGTSGRDVTCGDFRIATGATFTSNTLTELTVAGDFTTSGGLIGKSALDMDGSSTTVEVSDASDFDGLTNATWMGWFKLDDVSIDRNFMGQSSSFSLQVFENSTNKTRFSLYDGSSWTDLEGNTTITVDNKWHHIAFVMDGSNNKMYTYIDGKLDAEGAWTGTLNGSGADIYLGGYRDGNEKHFAGLYDSASIWNVALTSAQIRAKMFSDFASLDSNTGCVEISCRYSS